jgi:hypothetical protein
MKTRTLVLVAAAAVASLSMGCAGSPAAPFNQLAESPVTVYRLQNYQDQPVATATPATPAPGTGGSLIPGLPIPPEFQPQVQQAQQMICGFLPPGSPGCTPGGSTTPMPTTPAVQNAPMFQGYRIIGQAQVMDTKMRSDIIDIFGYEKSFGPKKSPCMFPELGLSFGAGGAQTADVLVSFSCNQVQARNFAWPHPDNGMKDETVKKLSAIIQKLFGGG